MSEIIKEAEGSFKKDKPVGCSIVVPVYNEEESLKPLLSVTQFVASKPT